MDTTVNGAEREPLFSVNEVAVRVPVFEKVTGKCRIRENRQRSESRPLEVIEIEMVETP